MRVYLVVGESGEYSDWTSWIESVHATKEGAIESIERRTYEIALDADGNPMRPWRYDESCDGESRAVTLFSHPKRMGNAWLDPDGTDPYGDEDSWHIEEFEVME